MDSYLIRFRQIPFIRSAVFIRIYSREKIFSFLSRNSFFSLILGPCSRIQSHSSAVIFSSI